MNYYLTFFLQPVLPLAFLMGAMWAFVGNISFKRLTLLTLLGGIVGVGLTVFILNGQQAQLIFNLFSLGVYLLFLVALGFNRSRLFFIFQTLFGLIIGVSLGSDPNFSLITSTDVVNTDFLLNLSATVFGIFLSFLLSFWFVQLLRQRQAFNKNPQLFRWLVVAFVFFCLILPLTGNVLLSLMKLQVIALTKFRLSFVAKVRELSNFYNYLNVSFILFLTLSFVIQVVKPLKQHVVDETHPIEKRKKQARFQTAKSTAWVGFSLAVIIFFSQLYWDKVASQPPALSASTFVTLEKDGKVHLPIEPFLDGELHRFVWVASDGKAVRFFIINRSEKKLSLGVAFDACLLCGDSGYVKEGDKLMCVACGVRLFIPSVGKPGGCNPIPIDGWEQTDSEVILSKKILLSGANYFSTVMELEVTDPVSGKKLTNKAANFRYDFDDTTYFFENETNQEAFRENPERFLKEAK